MSFLFQNSSLTVEIFVIVFIREELGGFLSFKNMDIPLETGGPREFRCQVVVVGHPRGDRGVGRRCGMWKNWRVDRAWGYKI